MTQPAQPSRWRLAIPWLVIGFLLLVAGMIYWIGGRPPAESLPDSLPAPEVSGQDSAPPPSPTPPPPQIPPPDISSGSSDIFPEAHAGFRLASVKAEAAVKGVSAYHVARYKSSDGEEVVVRLVLLDKKNAEAFIRQTLRALGGAAPIQSAGAVKPRKDSGWSAAQLFSREGAGIYLAFNQKALLIASAPSPEAARVFGESLPLRLPH